jgi:hypothetical protein
MKNNFHQIPSKRPNVQIKYYFSFNILYNYLYISILCIHLDVWMRLERLDIFGRSFGRFFIPIWTKKCVWTEIWTVWTKKFNKKIRSKFINSFIFSNLATRICLVFWTFGRLDVWNKKTQVCRIKIFLS